MIIFFTGLGILVLPDKATPVIDLNKAHGPSIPDLAGLFLMAISWLISTIFIFKSWVELRNKLSSQVLFILVVIYLISVTGIVAGLNLSSEWLLWVSVAAASLINISIIVSAFRIPINKS